MTVSRSDSFDWVENSSPNRLNAAPPYPPQRITHGRHCKCGSCAREDWTNPDLAPCGMHGSDCPALYQPLGAPGDVVSRDGVVTRPLVSDEYARAYEAGALAALEWLNDNYPDLEAAGDDCPSPTMLAAEHIGGVIDMLLGRLDA